MMELEKDEKEPTQDELLKLLERKEESVKVTEKSHLANYEYLDFFGDLSKETMTKDTLIQKLRQSKIKYESHKDSKYYSIRIVKSACDSQIVTLEVSIGPFALFINLYNCSTKNYTHFLQGKTSTFATIYDFSFDQSKAIIKCTTFKPKDFLDTLIVVVKQYSFLKIAAALEVGPQITPIFGFDLLVFEDCIEFSMQKCEPLFGIDENIVKTLKEKLLILHKLKIVHIDIKPQNFSHSPLLNQPIFIDFGLSQVILQLPGECTETSFMGSLNYCSPEMTKLYYQSNNGPVDLYMNDVICMKKSFTEMAQQRQKSQKVNFLREEEYIDSQNSEDEIDAYPSATESKKVAINFIFMRIKNLIFSEEDISNWYEQYESYLIKLKDNILSFIQNLSYSVFLEELCRKLLSYNKFDRFLCYNFISRLEKKGNLSKSSKSSVSDDYSENPTSFAFIRMNEIGSLLTIKSIYLSKKELQPQLNINVFLETPQLIFKADKSIIFHKFMQFSDLRTAITTNNKRLKVAKLLINHLKLSEPSCKQIINYLCVCWRHILSLELQSPSKHFFSNITTAIHNLMIVQNLSLQEYCQLFQEISNLPIQNLRKCELLYMCATSSTYQWNKFHSEYDYFQFRTKFVKTITFELDKLKSLVPYNLMDMFVFLVIDASEFCDPTSSYPYQQQLQTLANLLSFQVYQDCRKNLKASLLKLRYQTETRPSIKQIYELINSQPKDRFNYYHFHIFASCWKGGHNSIILNIFNFISRCWEGSDLLANFKIYHDVMGYLQNINNRPNLHYYDKLLTRSITIDRIYKQYPIFVILLRFIQKTFPMTSQLQEIHNKISNIVNHSFMLSLINADQKYPEMALLYEIYSFCFVIYIQLYQKESGYSQKIQEIIEQFSKRWEAEDARVRCNTLVHVCSMIGSALSSISKHQQSIEFQMYFTSLHQSQLSKVHLSLIINNICQVVCTSQLTQKTRYYDFIYSALRHINNPRQIIQGGAFRLFSEINFHLLANRKDTSYFFDFHMDLWTEMQRDFKNERMSAYFHACYVFFLRFPEECTKLAERIKLLPLNFFKNCERYNCACIMILLLILEKKYDAVSLRILILIVQTLPRIRLYPNAAIRNILYSYLINREVSALSQNRNAFKAPFHGIVPQLLDYRTRKISYWARKVVKLTRVNYNQEKAYNNVLIMKYDRSSHFCLLFDRFLKRSY